MDPELIAHIAERDWLIVTAALVVVFSAGVLVAVKV